MAKIGPGIAGGNNRQQPDRRRQRGASPVPCWCEAAGLMIGCYTMGNMFARGAKAPTPTHCPFYMGSHLDTQPTGGKYDGVLGVLGRARGDAHADDLGIRTRHPIVVTNWTNEEGTRLCPSAMLASGVFAGIHTQDFAYDRTDAEGKKFGDELERIGWWAMNRSARARCMRCSHILH